MRPLHRNACPSLEMELERLKVYAETDRELLLETMFECAVLRRIPENDLLISITHLSYLVSSDMRASPLHDEMKEMEPYESCVQMRCAILRGLKLVDVRQSTRSADYMFGLTEKGKGLLRNLPARIRELLDQVPVTHPLDGLAAL